MPVVKRDRLRNTNTVAGSQLLGWLLAPDDELGPSFACDDGSWEHHSWADVARRVHDAAHQIADQRRSAGDPVVIVLPSGVDFLAAFFGTLLAGNIPCPIAPPNPLQHPGDYASHVAALLRIADPALVVAGPQIAGLVGQATAAAASQRRPLVLDPTAAGDEHSAQAPAKLALLQFTSGSSGRPRAARVSWQSLQANIEMMRDWVFADRGHDQIASWLPHYHDMGLIGCQLAAAVYQGRIRIMRPDQFVRQPVRWLECFGRLGATLGAAPTFGYLHLLRRLRLEQLDGMDFSGWRVACVGAERIDAGIVSRFAAMLAPYGFRESALSGGYGLAEATLLVTGRDPRVQTPTPVVKVDWSTLELGAPVDVVDSTVVGDTARIGDGTGWLVSCGWTHRGVSVSVLDEDGNALAPGHLGELCVAGRCVADGYHGDDGGPARFVDGSVQTGDAGFVLDGELYVVGRIGDSLKVRGRTVYAEDLEARLTQVPGVGHGRCAVATGGGSHGPVVAALFERPPGPWIADARRILNDAVGGMATVHVLTGRPGSIPRTSSGKPRRRVMWRAFLGGTLAAGHAIDPSAVGAALPVDRLAR